MPLSTKCAGRSFACFASVLFSAFVLSAAPVAADFIEQGGKLIGTDSVGTAPNQGGAVALSADGNTLVVGARNDSNGVGATWVFTRANGVWSQQGGKLVGSGRVGNSQQGFSVAISGDGKADILWRHSGGTVLAWLMNGASVTQAGSVGGADSTWQIVGTGDFNGDGKGDILWRHNSGAVAAWLLNGVAVTQSGGVGSADANWTIAETGDLNGDGGSDILWRHSSGQVATWLMNGVSVLQSASVGGATTDWVIQATNAN